jgi:hypothetical protein
MREFSSWRSAGDTPSTACFILQAEWGNGAIAARLFSPTGRRWRQPDEGGFAATSSIAYRSGRSLLRSLTPSSVLSDIFSPLGRRGNAWEASQ